MDQPPRPSASQSSGSSSPQRPQQFEPYASVPSSYAQPGASPAGTAKPIPATPIPAAPIEDEIQLEEDVEEQDAVSLIEAELEEEDPKAVAAPPRPAPAPSAPAAAPPSQPKPASAQPAAHDQLSIEASAHTGEESTATFTSKIKAFGIAGEHKKRTWKRQTKATGTGAVRVRTFHGKLSDQGMGFLDDAINDWLDQHPEIEIKYVTSSVGVFEGKIREPALILNLWY